MALLSFPPSPNNGDVYPVTPAPGQNQYQWESATFTWRLIGPATTVTPGTYGNSTCVGQFSVDAQGRITAASNVPISVIGTVTQIDTGLGLTGGPITGSGTISALQANPNTQGVIYGYTPLTGSNVSLGYGNLRNATGGCNTAVGRQALVLNTTGIGNTGLGSQSLCSNVTGNQNTAVGSGTLSGLNFGCFNTALGSGAGQCLTSGSGNVAIGLDALCSTISSCCNVAIGFCAGTSITSGSKNVIIGPGVQPTSGAGSCQLALGFGPGLTWLRGDSNRNVRFGAGVIDCTGRTGAPGEILTSTGTAIFWKNCTTLGTVTRVNTGVGLSGGPITSCGTISLNTATTSCLGGVIPDGITVTVDPSGVISAVQDQEWLFTPSPFPYLAPSKNPNSGILLGPGAFDGASQIQGTSASPTGNQWTISDSTGGGYLSFATAGSTGNPTKVTSTGALEITASANGVNDTPLSVANGVFGINTTSPNLGTTVTLQGNPGQTDLLLLRGSGFFTALGLVNQTSGTLPQATIRWVESSPGVTNDLVFVAGTAYLELVSTGEWEFNTGGSYTLRSDVAGNVTAQTSFIAPHGNPNLPSFKFPQILGEDYGLYSEVSSQSTGMAAGGNYVAITNGGYLESGNSGVLGFSVDVTGSSIGRGRFFGVRGLTVPSGTKLQRPSVPLQGEIRFNSDSNGLEVNRQFGITDWVPLVTVVGDTVPNPPWGFIPSSPTDPGLPGQIAYDSNNFYAYDGTLWQSIPWGGGGGGGGSVTATAPIVSSGGATPNISINLATTSAPGAVQVGANVQVAGGVISVLGGTAMQKGVVQVGANIQEASNVISVLDGTTSQKGVLQVGNNIQESSSVISVLDASNAQKGVIEIATLAEAAAGTSTTLASTPETSVPKDAAGMTGAAILPSGFTGQQPATPVTGMTRFNLTTDDLEFYTGSDWNGATAKVTGAGATYDEGASVLPAGTTAQRPSISTLGMTRINTTTNSPESYINGTWSPIQSTQSGPFAGFRNLLINGNFSINQRGYVSGTAVGAANTYTLDRWKVLLSGQAVTFSAFSNGRIATAPPGGLQQVIESVNVAGGTYTLSWVGTATATVNGVPVSNGGQVNLPANTQATVTFSGGTVRTAQLEPGWVASPFEQRMITTELMMCQRYYEHSGGSTDAGWKTNSWPAADGVVVPAGNAKVSDFFARFQVEKRVAPTVTWYSATGVAGNAAWEQPGVTNDPNFSSANLAGSTITTVMARLRGNTLPVDAWLYANWEASAEL